MPESASSRASSPGTPAHGQAATINKQTYAHAVAKPYREALKLRLDLNLEVEISIKAKVNGDITLSLLFEFLLACSTASKSSQWFTINFTIAAHKQVFVMMTEMYSASHIFCLVVGAGLVQKKDDGIDGYMLALFLLINSSFLHEITPESSELPQPGNRKRKLSRSRDIKFSIRKRDHAAYCARNLLHKSCQKKPRTYMNIVWHIVNEVWNNFDPRAASHKVRSDVSSPQSCFYLEKYRSSLYAVVQGVDSADAHSSCQVAEQGELAPGRDGKKNDGQR
ncbi:hypothetical protein DFS33DRAFT_1454459 [Desarmillaria ectypa]|nr:hypothetical protein DFS33DRAFT_1454459 [Desarmillaria ectypa]